MDGQTGIPWPYFFIRLLFKFVLKIFYGTIVVENAHLIPRDGQPCIVCSNHPNSLTDAILLVASIPAKRRRMLRLTAKSTQFGKRTFVSWLIEAAGAVPIKRRKDYDGEEVDNTEVMEVLKQTLESGDAVCIFPEGGSRFHPAIAPMKTGVARLVSDLLTRNKDSADFQVSVLTCSITYMHRQHFRSDVLVTFHEPMTFSPKKDADLVLPVEFRNIRSLTARIHDQISSGTIDSLSWDMFRSAKIAARMYAPLGTNMSLGDYVRVCRAFVEIFKWAELKTIRNQSITSGSEEEISEIANERLLFVDTLRKDLKDYQDRLAQLGLKDDRIRRPLKRRVILRRIPVRASWICTLAFISLPGLLLWLPIFITTQIAVRNFKRTGPIWDTWDEIAQYKLVYGLFSGIAVWMTCIVFTFPVAFLTAIGVPLLMWMTLRWLEDLVSSSRALTALLRLLWTGKATLKQLHTQREEIHARVTTLAVEYIGLPQNPADYFSHSGGGEKGRVRGSWESNMRYFSIRRRRKRDWNETLRLYDKVDYPDDALF